MSYVFVSYSRQNLAIVSEVVSSLRSKNMKLWQDISGKSYGIPNSTKWFNVIEDALYRACGAIIFVSDMWERSKPCQDEYKLIIQNLVPFIKVDLRNDQSVPQIIDQISKWYVQTVDTEENFLRTDLLTRVKDYQEDKNSYRTFPPKTQLKQLEKYAAAMNGFAHNLELKANIREYIYAASKSNRRKTIMRITGVLVTAILVIMVYLNWIFIKTLDLVAKDFLDLSSGTIAITESMHINPYSTMDKLVSGTSSGKQAEFMSCRNLVVLNNLHLPIAYITNADQNARNFLEMKEKSRLHIPSDYTILPDPKSGLVMLVDRKLQISKQFVVDGIVNDYAWNESGDIAALAVADKVYIVYKESSNTQPIILDGNFEDIASVGWDGNRVFAITRLGNVILWENPVRKQTNYHQLKNGKLLLNSARNISAVFIDSGNLIIDNPQGEETIPIKVSGNVINDHIAVSHNGKLAAFYYQTTDLTGIHILIFDLASKRTIADYPIACIPMELTFSKDDNSILVACYDSKGIAKLDLTDGHVSFSQKGLDAYVSITTTGDNYLVSTFHGDLVLYDKDLKIIGNGGFDSGSNGNIPTNLTASEKYGFAFYTNYAGNKMRNKRVTLSDRSSHYILPIPANDTERNTCVSVSGDGDFVAFGYPNGQIAVYDVKNFTTLWSSNIVQEKIIDLLFTADNGQIYALGKSGTIYSFATEGMIQPARTDIEVTAHWQRLVQKAAAKNELEYKLGLSNIPPQQFGLKTNNSE